MQGHVQIGSNMPVSIRSSELLVQNLENLTTKSFFSSVFRRSIIPLFWLALLSIDTMSADSKSALLIASSH